jgi:hypothetical protein
MRSCKHFIVPAGIALLLTSAGCQTSGRSTASDGGGLSRSFGLVPQQSEPPVEESGTRGKSAARLPNPDTTEDGDSGGKTTSPGTAPEALARLFTGKDKKPAERKTLPLSAKSTSADNRAETED